MNLSELRQWFFEVVGILLPGTAGVLVITAFSLQPSEFGTEVPSSNELAAVLAPFSSQMLNGILLLVFAFFGGHVIQQLSVYLLQLHARLFRVRDQSLIPEVFGNTAVRQFLVPLEASFDPSAAGLTHNDYFMMVYPDLAPHTKRETFIALSGFSGAMALVTLLAVALIATAAAIRLVTGLPFSATRVMIGVISGVALTEIWVARCTYFHAMADRVVVTYFLRKFGTNYRRQSQRKARP